MTSGKQKALLDEIQEAPGPLSASEIWDRLRSHGVRIGIATVYRILKNETGSGNLERIEFPGGQTRYESAGREHHHHFLCTSCDRAFDVEGCPDGIQEIALPGFTVTNHVVTLYGKCGDCQEVV